MIMTMWTLHASRPAQFTHRFVAFGIVYALKGLSTDVM